MTYIGDNNEDEEDPRQKRQFGEKKEKSNPGGDGETWSQT